MEQQNIIKGKVTPADLSPESYTDSNFVVGVHTGILLKKIVCQENNCGHIFMVPRSTYTCFKLCEVFCFGMCGCVWMCPFQLCSPMYQIVTVTFLNPKSQTHPTLCYGDLNGQYYCQKLYYFFLSWDKINIP